ncbi:MAG: TIGR02281 family clan AA aspartic protease [Sphingomonas bacterium]
MSADTNARALYLMLLLVLIVPGAALAARRVPWKNTAKMALAWVGIFAVALVVVSFRDSYRRAWQGAQEVFYGQDESITGGAVSLAMADDGHFWANVSVNGVRRRMLIDSGATTTSLSVDTAKAAGLDLEQSPFPTVLDTANGSVVARVSTVRLLKLGGIDAHDLPVVVAPAFGDTDVLGMNFLSKLRAWRVEGQTLVLEPK